MRVYLNGNIVETSAKSVSYETICETCGFSIELNPTVTYSRGKGLEKGVLFSGLKVSLSEGMHITCVVTNNA